MLACILRLFDQFVCESCKIGFGSRFTVTVIHFLKEVNRLLCGISCITDPTQPIVYFRIHQEMVWEEG